MQCSKTDLPPVFASPMGEWRMVEWEGMNVEYMSFPQKVDTQARSCCADYPMGCAPARTGGM
jgi:hypothetical protein